jgi:hypothetical protein
MRHDIKKDGIPQVRDQWLKPDALSQFDGTAEAVP